MYPTYTFPAWSTAIELKSSDTSWQAVGSSGGAGGFGSQGSLKTVVEVHVAPPSSEYDRKMWSKASACV
jgi:hypothetical protein